MKRPSVLVALVAVFLPIVLLEPTANAVVHRLTPTLTRRPKDLPLPNKHTSPNGQMDHGVIPHHGHGWGLDHGLRRLRRQLHQHQYQQKLKTAGNDTSCADSSGKGCNGSEQLDIVEEYYYDLDTFFLATEMYIGTPAQGPFWTELVFGVQYPYVMGLRAMLRSGGLVDDQFVREYNKTASSTAVEQDASFEADGYYISGSVVSDVVRLGDQLSITYPSVQVAQVEICYHGADSSLGLGVSPTRSGSSFVEQLASQLDSPVMTVYASLFLGVGDNGQGQMSFGDRLPETCDSSSWIRLSNSNQSITWPVVDVVSFTVPDSDSGDCGDKVTANITVDFIYDDIPIMLSSQVEYLFVQASGARFSDDVYDYDDPDDSVLYRFMVDDPSKAQSVKFHTASGDVLEVTPDDYLRCDQDICYLGTYGYYDQNNPTTAGNIMALTMSFLNNHCLSMDMTSGEWSLANAFQSTVSDDIIDTSSTSSASSEGANYIGRKH